MRSPRSEALVLPWSKKDQAAADAEPRLDDDYWASHYLGYLAHRPDSVSAALRSWPTAAGATIVHCAAGKDRTGTVVGLALSVAGVSDEDVVADYVATGERIERVVARLMARPAYGEVLEGSRWTTTAPGPRRCSGSSSVLAERYGGAAGWLRAQGWSASEITALRTSLRG